MQETQEMRVRSLGLEDPLEEEMATHSSILAGKTPWTEEPGGLQLMGPERVGRDWATARTWALNSFIAQFQEYILWNKITNLWHFLLTFRSVYMQRKLRPIKVSLLKKYMLQNRKKIIILWSYLTYFYILAHFLGIGCLKWNTVIAISCILHIIQWLRFSVALPNGHTFDKMY